MFQIKVLGVREIGAERAIWEAKAAMSDLELLGKPLRTAQGRSVVLVNAATFDPTEHSLSFSPREATTVIGGDTTDIIFVGNLGGAASREAKSGDHNRLARGEASEGDADYLAEIGGLPETVRSAGQHLLQSVRAFYKGSLVRGQQRNFAEAPDNFWAVRVQPRAETLSVTVRGNPFYFGATPLDLKPDRKGYTRFTVRTIVDAEEALKIIRQAKRKF